MALSGLIVTDSDSTMVAFGNPTVSVTGSGSGSGGTSIFSQTTPKTVENEGAETTLVDSGVGTAVIAANAWGLGYRVRGKVEGIYSTRDLSAGTMAVTLSIGAVTWDWVINTLETQPNQTWCVEYDIVRLSIGGSGTIRGNAWLTYQEQNAAAVTVGVGMAAAATLASNVQQAVNVTVDWQNVDTDNSWTVYLNAYEIIATA